MSFWNLLRELRGCPAARRSLRRPRQASRSCRPVLEALEDRCLLSYSIFDLGTLGGESSYAYGINASGQVVGYSLPPGLSGWHAFATPPMQDLGTLGGDGSFAWGINDSGQVVGDSQTAASNAVTHAFLYDATATPAMQDLGTLGGTTSSAYGINTSGQAVGNSRTAGSFEHAFLYDGTATPAMQDLGTLGGYYSFAYGINNSSQVVGNAQTGGNGFHAFLYDATATPAMQDLGTLGGSYSYAFGINDSSQVVGYSYLAGNSVIHAFLYDATATPAMQDLGTFGGSFSHALGINASGQVVGDAYTADNIPRAFVYDGTAMLDLNGQIPPASGWNLHTAQAINDNGQIVGWGLINARIHAFLLTPIPVPGPGPAPHGTPASLATRPVPVNTAFVVGGGSMLAVDATLASTAALGPVLATFDRAPIPAARAPTDSDQSVDAAPALAPQAAVTPEQRASLHLGSVHAADGLDPFFADLGQDMWWDGRPIS
jgi:probable HAF family extracellular repeat protein